jgi:hypothetical protein
MSFSSNSSSAGAVYIELPPWHTSDWDTGVFDDQVVPGLIHVEIDRGPKWDRKPVKGQTGETQTFGGWNNADMKIRVRTWTTSQYEDFLARIVPILEPDPGKDAPKEIRIGHPTASARKVESFRVAKLKGPIANFKDGYTEWDIDAFQAIKKAPAPKGPPGQPGATPCQKLRKEYEFWQQKCATLNAYMGQLQVQIATIFGDPMRASELANLTAALDGATAELALADNSMRLASQQMAELGCGEQSPSSQAAAGDVPPP